MTSSKKASGGGFGPPTLEDVIELLLNWYIQKTGPSHLQTIQETKRILRLYGKIREEEKPPHPMGNFVVGGEHDF